MIPAQRRRDILKLIAAQGSGTITELSQKYGVSEMTIRRDLKALDEEGRLKYTRGGAIHVGTVPAELHYTAKQQLNMPLKQRIARYAATYLVEDDDVIILEPGTTATAMVPYLADKEALTVVTNGLYTANELRSLLPKVTVICTGGILRDVSSTFVGPLAERFFREFYAQKLFLSGTYFTLEAGLTDPQMMDTQVKQAMVEAADCVIALIDSTKFGLKSLATVLGAYDMDVLVTDDGAPPDVLEQLRQRGVDVRVVSEQ